MAAHDDPGFVVVDDDDDEDTPLRDRDDSPSSILISQASMDAPVNLLKPRLVSADDIRDQSAPPRTRQRASAGRAPSAPRRRPAANGENKSRDEGEDDGDGDDSQQKRNAGSGATGEDDNPRLHLNRRMSRSHPNLNELARQTSTLVIDTIAQLPDDCKKKLKRAKLPNDLLEKHFNVTLNILYFETRKKFITSQGLTEKWEMKQAKKKSRSKRSNRFETKSDDAEKLLTDGHAKKMFKSVHEVGHGGFGRVFQAKSTVDKKKKHVAIKRMPHVTSRDKRRNFRELKVLEYCDHPNIVKYYRAHDFTTQPKAKVSSLFSFGKKKKGKDDKMDKNASLNEIWLIIEFMEGGTIGQAAAACQFNEGCVAYVAREVLKGLTYLHERNIAHRDLKSANVMLSVDGDVKLIDFGLAADMTDGPVTEMCGSPYWVPPEMIKKEPHDCKVDIWSMAVCLLELGLQKPPNHGSSFKAMFLAATEGINDRFAYDVSDACKDFFDRCLQIDPSARATAAELLEHEWIKKEPVPKSEMKRLLSQIFLANALRQSGFGI